MLFMLTAITTEIATLAEKSVVIEDWIVEPALCKSFKVCTDIYFGTGISKGWESAS